ncbi:GNAT family N-acetyltransferase [Bacillus nakamurai]|uniref:GNAT family N-acetyltransferase n=1 Tax=Bacillus nakamurai TaxID=1793963 RepID=UPI0020C4B93B|nr:GNAT family N-acetyltransferase [Bacillus nakamurai]MCP6684035.1 GNAT family N-acetyltransferase [Bacillus nakamurai]
MCLGVHRKQLKEYWGSVFRFLSHGFGFSAFYHGKPVSECTSIFTGDKRAEMDITTQAGFRGMGLAGMTAKAFINQCLTCDLTPGWVAM